jgi:hypothetical protein
MPQESKVEPDTTSFRPIPTKRSSSQGQEVGLFLQVHHSERKSEWRRPIPSGFRTVNILGRMINRLEMLVAEETTSHSGWQFPGDVFWECQRRWLLP